MAGDFNAHHVNWSCKNNSRGQRLLDASLEHNFVSLNTGEVTRAKLVNGYLQETSPDITFVTSDIAIYFKWQVTRENLGSDHLIIKYSMKFRSSRNVLKRRNFKIADWKLYKDSFKNKFDDLVVDENNLQPTYDLFMNYLGDAANKSIPMIKISTEPTQTFQPKPYWTPELSKAIAERRLALKNFRRNPIPNNLDILNTKMAEAQRIHRQARSSSWQQFCSSITKQ